MKIFLQILTNGNQMNKIFAARILSTTSTDKIIESAAQIPSILAIEIIDKRQRIPNE